MIYPIELQALVTANVIDSIEHIRVTTLEENSQPDTDAALLVEVCSDRRPDENGFGRGGGAQRLRSVATQPWWRAGILIG